MALGYSRPLYLLAFDHRGSPEHDRFGAPHPVPGEVRAGISGAREVIYVGFAGATGRGVPRDAARKIADHYLETVNGFAV
jgi:5-dehydro-2-deoxygluconokinase